MQHCARILPKCRGVRKVMLACYSHDNFARKITLARYTINDTTTVDVTQRHDFTAGSVIPVT